MNRSNRMSTFNDAYIYRKLSKGVRGTTSNWRFTNWLSSFIVGIFQFFINIGAFSVRIFLRWNMGIRSFGFLSIILSYLGVRLFLIHTYLFNISCEEFYDLAEGQCKFTGHLSFWFTPILDLFKEAFWGNENSLIDTYLLPYLLPNAPVGIDVHRFGIMLHWFSISILVLGLLHLLSAHFREIRKIKQYSLHRGYSIFFSWLEGKKLLGITTIDRHIIWVFFDPLLVVLTAFLIEYHFEIWAFPLCLIIGAICLFVQELHVWGRDKDMLRNMFDQEYESERLLQEREQYRDFKLSQSRNTTGNDGTRVQIS